MFIRWKKWFWWAIAVAQAGENHEDECGFTWYFLKGTKASIPDFIQELISSAHLETESLKNVWHISDVVTKEIPITTLINIGSSVSWRFLLWWIRKFNADRDNDMIRVTQWSKNWRSTIFWIRGQEQVEKIRRLIITVQGIKSWRSTIFWIKGQEQVEKIRRLIITVRYTSWKVDNIVKACETAKSKT